jgi:hypothetical protein
LTLGGRRGTDSERKRYEALAGKERPHEDDEENQNKNNAGEARRGDGRSGMRDDADRALRLVEVIGMLVGGKTIRRQ